jgi:NAD(P)H-hydrate epimerase
MYVHTGQDTYATDKMMEEVFHVSPKQLMEVAGKNVADQVMKYSDQQVRHAMILIGPGNNGGDGAVVARFLIASGWRVQVVPVFSCDHIKGAAKENLHTLHTICQNPVFHSQIVESYCESSFTQDFLVSYLKDYPDAVVIDAIFGVGLKRPITGKAAACIHALNASKHLVFSIDIPSGINSETGIVVGNDPSSAIKADYTITFEAPKVGHLLYPGKYYSGNLIVTQIGVLHQALPSPTPLWTILKETDFTSFLHPRTSDSYKGSFGRVVSICGSPMYQGALTLSLLGALHSGAGLVTAGYKETNSDCLAKRVIPEATHLPIPVENGQYTPHSTQYLQQNLPPDHIVCMGSGIGRENDVMEMAHTVYHTLPNPMVVDADALWAIRDNPQCIAGIRILTPHLGEMSFLTQISIEEIRSHQVEIALEYAAKWKTIVVLKSSTTLVAEPQGSCYMNAFSTSALAKGGSGDVLAGTIAGFLAQGYSAFQSSIVGVALHSIAGLKMEQDVSSWASSPSHLPLYYCSVFKQMTRQ